MTTEEQVRQLMHREAAEISVGAAPTSELVRRGRRSAVRWRAVPLLAAAVTVGIVLVVAGWLSPDAGDVTRIAPVDEAPLTRITPVDEAPLVINTGDWRPGDAAMRALFRLELRVSADGCVQAGTPDRPRAEVWPAGYTAERRAEGVVVMGPDGRVVAAEGRKFSAGGGLGGSASAATCLSETGEIVYVQDVLPPLHAPEPHPDKTTKQPPSDPLTESDIEALSALVAFAADPRSTTFDRLPLAPQVALGLGNEIRERVNAEVLAQPSAWMLPMPTQGFAGRSLDGSISALRPLRAGLDGQDIASDPAYEVTSGPDTGCFTPTGLPDHLRGLRQLNIEPSRTRSCLDWYAVEVYLDSNDDIAAVLVDLWEP